MPKMAKRRRKSSMCQTTLRAQKRMANPGDTSVRHVFKSREKAAKVVREQERANKATAAQ